jgi:hypothetical protein
MYLSVLLIFSLQSNDPRTAVTCFDWILPSWVNVSNTVYLPCKLLLKLEPQLTLIWIKWYDKYISLLLILLYMWAVQMPSSALFLWFCMWDDILQCSEVKNYPTIITVRFNKDGTTTHKTTHNETVDISCRVARCDLDGSK